MENTHLAIFNINTNLFFNCLEGVTEEQAIQSISTKVPRRHLDIDALLLIRSQIENGDFAAFVEYDLVPSDLDILNHLSPLTKLKAKTISTLKKQCAEAIANHALQRKSHL
jgi:hypothetical protein